MERIKSFLQKLEDWFIDNDLHIYFGALTVVVISVLGWMLKVETDKTAILRSSTTYLSSEVVEKDRLIYNLQMELSNIKSHPPQPLGPPKPVVETVDRMSNNLNDKIEKVQSSLISIPQTKIITRTEVQTVEKVMPVDAELKTMMRQSFCSSFPEDKVCKVKK